MKKFAKRQPDSSLHVLCPFCDFAVSTWGSTMKWCGGCRVEWYVNRAGDVVFDDRRKTPRYAFAKALAAAGGVKIGGDR